MCIYMYCNYHESRVNIVSREKESITKGAPLCLKQDQQEADFARN